MKNYSIAHNCKNGNYYIFHKDDVDKWGTERQRVIYESPSGYFYTVGRRCVYLTDEETESLNRFREKNRAEK